MTVRILTGDARAMLRTLPDESVHCVVSSPPYWGLRDYQLNPLVWGGRDDCEHVWGETVVLGLPTGDAHATVVRKGRRNLEEQRCKRERGCWCQACGAWRGQLGLEPTPQLYVAHLVEIFREVRRVLRPDGTLWLNLGDCYATGAGAAEAPGGGEQGARWRGDVTRHRDAKRRDHGRPSRNGRGEPQKTRATRDGTHAGKHTAMAAIGPMTQPNRMPIPGLKPKDLVGVPWRVAFALQEDGWWLRQDCIWAKPNPMPESVEDRCTKAHEYLFLLSKSELYHFDQEAILEPAVRAEEIRWAGELPGMHSGESHPGQATRRFRIKGSGNKARKAAAERGTPAATGKNQCASVPWSDIQRNKRSVWTVSSQPFNGEFCTACKTYFAGSALAGLKSWKEKRGKEDVLKRQCSCGAVDAWLSHFATFPPALIEPCIKASCPVGGIVLDPFFGAATTGLVADRLHRNCIGIEANPDYAEMGRQRIAGDAPLLAEVA